jgi:hypothetical protein
MPMSAKKKKILYSCRVDRVFSCPPETRVQSGFVQKLVNHLKVDTNCRAHLPCS